MKRYGFGELRYPDPGLPHYLVAVDLGKRKVGVAAFFVNGFNDAALVSAATVSGPNVAHLVRDYAHDLYGEAPVLWVCEWPLKYGDKRKYHSDIASLHAVGDTLDGLVDGWDEKYLPGQWKGHVPKRAHHVRLRRALTQDELDLAPPLEEHDAWDAIGIGLFATARTKRGGA